MAVLWIFSKNLLTDLDPSPILVRRTFMLHQHAGRRKGMIMEYIMIGIAAGGLAIGSGIFRGMSAIGRSIVKAAKIWSMTKGDPILTYNTADGSNDA